jgi:hypothetical protein
MGQTTGSIDPFAESGGLSPSSVTKFSENRAELKGAISGVDPAEH